MRLATGAIAGFAVFYFVWAFIAGDLLWPALMYNGAGPDEAERMFALSSLQFSRGPVRAQATRVLNHPTAVIQCGFNGEQDHGSNPRTGPAQTPVNIRSSRGSEGRREGPSGPRAVA